MGGGHDRPDLLPSVSRVYSTVPEGPCLGVSVASADGLPDGCLLSVRVGGQRRQMPLKPHAGGGQLCFDNAVVGAVQPIRVDVLSCLGSLSASPRELRAGKLRVDLGSADGKSMNVVLCFEDLEGRAASSHSSPVRPKPSSAEFSRTASARRYLEEHDLMEVVRGALNRVLLERPEDPHQMLADEVLKAGEARAGDPPGKESPLSVAGDLCKPGPLNVAAALPELEAHQPERPDKAPKAPEPKPDPGGGTIASAPVEPPLDWTPGEHANSSAVPSASGALATPGAGLEQTPAVAEEAASEEVSVEPPGLVASALAADPAATGPPAPEPAGVAADQSRSAAHSAAAPGAEIAERPASPLVPARPRGRAAAYARAVSLPALCDAPPAASLAPPTLSSDEASLETCLFALPPPPGCGAPMRIIDLGSGEVGFYLYGGSRPSICAKQLGAKLKRSFMSDWVWQERAPELAEELLSRYELDGDGAFGLPVILAGATGLNREALLANENNERRAAVDFCAAVEASVAELRWPGQGRERGCHLRLFVPSGSLEARYELRAVEWLISTIVAEQVAQDPPGPELSLEDALGFGGCLSAGGGSVQLSLRGPTDVSLFSAPLGNKKPLLAKMLSFPPRDEEVAAWASAVREGLEAAGFPRGLGGFFVGITAAFYAAKEAGCAERVVTKAEALEALATRLETCGICSDGSVAARSAANVALVRELLDWTLADDARLLFRRSWSVAREPIAATWTLGHFAEAEQAAALFGPTAGPTGELALEEQQWVPLARIDDGEDAAPLDGLTDLPVSQLTKGTTALVMQWGDNGATLHSVKPPRLDPDRQEGETTVWRCEGDFFSRFLADGQGVDAFASWLLAAPPLLSAWPRRRTSVPAPSQHLPEHHIVAEAIGAFGQRLLSDPEAQGRLTSFIRALEAKVGDKMMCKVRVRVFVPGQELSLRLEMRACAGILHTPPAGIFSVSGGTFVLALCSGKLEAPKGGPLQMFTVNFKQSTSCKEFRKALLDAGFPHRLRGRFVFSSEPAVRTAKAAGVGGKDMISVAATRALRWQSAAEEERRRQMEPDAVRPGAEGVGVQTAAPSDLVPGPLLSELLDWSLESTSRITFRHDWQPGNRRWYGASDAAPLWMVGLALALADRRRRSVDAGPASSSLEAAGVASEQA